MDISKNRNNEALENYIKSFKKRYGEKLLIPVHHYVPSEIVKFADIIGDSYRLAVKASTSSAKWIVFCGVSFMAEGVRILSSEDKTVLIPEPDAGCPMADMIDGKTALKAMESIKNLTGAMPAPVVYMNSSTDSKSICGEYSGSVCTSSNAEKIIKYYLEQGEKIFFFPDYNLGMNIGREAGLKNEEIAVIDSNFRIEEGKTPDTVKMFLWDGFCPVHYRFTTRDVENFRTKYPGGKVIVHPEVRPEVKAVSDCYGSTQKIYDMIKSSPEGSIWGVGTEYIFVKRMEQEFSGQKIVPLGDYTCVNMSKNTLHNLAEALHSIEEYESGTGDLKYPAVVEQEYVLTAKKALDKMISIVEKK